MLEDENEFLPPKEEEIPPHLMQKWEEREKLEGVIMCPSCKKQILAASSFCVYCGEPVEMPNRFWLTATTIGLLFVLLFLGIQIFI